MMTGLSLTACVTVARQINNVALRLCAGQCYLILSVESFSSFFFSSHIGTEQCDG